MIDQRTLSHASIPLLPGFPPFCISLSFPTDTAENAKNCRAPLALPPGGNGSSQLTPVMIAYGSKASKGTPMVAVVSAVVVWSRVGCRSEGRAWMEVERRRALGPGLGSTLNVNLAAKGAIQQRPGSHHPRTLQTSYKYSRCRSRLRIHMNRTS